MSSPPGRRGADECFRGLAAAVPVGVLRVRDGCIAWANRRLAEIAGRPLEGLKLSELLEDVQEGLPRTAGPDVVECVLRRPDGASHAVICRRAWDEDGDEAAWAVEDVTHVRLLERELLRAGQELALANRELAAARERFRTARAERDEILSVVSHELRTPLTVIGGYNRLLLAGEVGPLTEEQRGFLQECAKSCRRLEAFIANLLEASHVSRGGDEVLELGEGPLAPVIEEVATSFRPLLEQRHLSLDVELEADLRACFDRLRVEQILTNLLGNAVKYARVGGHIEVRGAALAAGGRRFVEIAVADDGPGVRPEDRDRIFDPYVRAGEASRAEGLGLGLAICRRLVEAHGGRIGVDERPGGGALFAFTLPADPPPGDVAARGR